MILWFIILLLMVRICNFGEVIDIFLLVGIFIFMILLIVIVNLEKRWRLVVIKWRGSFGLKGKKKFRN